MQSDTFNKLVDEISALTHRWSVQEIWFSGFGECLLHPNLSEYIKHIKNVLNVYVGITTNGLLLTPQTIEKLTSSGVTSIVVSIHGLETHYNQIIENPPFEILLKQMRNLIRSAAGKTSVSIAAVETNLNREHLHSGAFKEFWKNEGVRSVEIFPCHTRGGSFSDERIASFQKNVMLEDCAIFLPIQFIAWNGDLLGCCSDLDGETRIGNIHDNSLETLLMKKWEINNPRRRFARCRTCPDVFSAESVGKRD